MSVPSAEPCSPEEPPAEMEAALPPPGSEPAAAPAPPLAPPAAVRGAGPPEPRSSGPERPSEPAAGAMAEADRELRVPFIEAEETENETETEAAAGAAGGGWRCGRCGDGAALRWCISGTLCASFLGLGMSIAVLGPTFPTLAANVGKNVSDIYYIFVGRSLGSLGGSVVGGVLLDCMNATLLLAFSMLGTAAGLYVIPWCKQSLVLTILMSVIGGSMGILDTGGNVLALYTWGSEAGPHLQALHFCFAAGAFLAPMVAQMDLGSSTSEELAGAEKTNQSVLRSVPTASAASTTPALNDHRNESFLWSYIFIGTYILLVFILFFALFLKSSSTRDKSKASAQKDKLAKYHWPLVGLLFVFFLFYVGAEVTYGSYVYTYAMVFAEMKESEAATLNSVFWGTFAVCRGAAIFGAAFLSPATMIAMSLLCSAASSTALAFFAHYRAALWVGTAVYGASMATIFPSGIAWIEQYTVVEGKTASLFVVGAALGEMCIPVAVGYLQGRYHQVPVVMYTAFATSLVTVLLFPAMYKLANWPQQRDSQEASDRETRKTLLWNSRLTEDEEEHEREWNDADFEVVEMNDKLKNSLTDTSHRIPGDSPVEIPLQPHLDNALGDPPVVADGSPGRQNGSVDWEKSEQSQS
ncbi:sodium-dependent glucose transporter 1 [Haemorhous mexicanus]|uniref:sodium-dependent glucose transporter 1 n=1 Tax=Haemorhous mexicanus TaxID=30427 RepID=UPI0028BDB3BE|nr:sodium-dependent glucose transporter 1 [Haemorhous mexicanus]